MSKEEAELLEALKALYKSEEALLIKNCFLETPNEYLDERLVYGENPFLRLVVKNTVCGMDHEIVENQVLNQKFYYCRTCKKEVN
jgi:hypothetical protein